MNDTYKHFEAVCPHCEKSLRIRQDFAGQQVQCKLCNETFLAVKLNGTGPSGWGEADSGSAPPSSEEERIAVACPSCQTILSVRRVYIGARARCKHCHEKFLVSDPAAGRIVSLDDRPNRLETQDNHESPAITAGHRPSEIQHIKDDLDHIQAEIIRILAENEQIKAIKDRNQAEIDRLRSKNQRLRSERNWIRSEHERSSSENQQLQAELEQIRTELDRLRQEHNPITTERVAIRTDLGEIAPTEVGPLAGDRASLIAEVDRHQQEIESVRLEQAASEQEEGARSHDLDVVQIELDRLGGLLKARETELEATRGEQDRLVIERQQALDEAEQIRSTLANRDQAVRDEGDRLRGEADQLRLERDRFRADIEDLRRSLDQAQHDHCAELARRAAQLQEAYEQAQRTDAFHAEGDRLRAEIEDLRRALNRAQHDHRAELSHRDAQLRQAHEQVQRMEAFGEGDRLRLGGDPLRAEIGGLLRALNDTEPTRRDDLARLEADLGVLAEEYCQLQGHRTTGHPSNESQGRNPVPPADLDRLQSDAPSPASNEGLQAALAEVESLKQKLTQSERSRREMIDYFDGIGIRYWRTKG